ncbi:MAG: hypothetical protein V1740_00280 [Candidatus Woesearchaeota archaeon]
MPDDNPLQFLDDAKENAHSLDEASRRKLRMAADAALGLLENPETHGLDYKRLKKNERLQTKLTHNFYTNAIEGLNEVARTSYSTTNFDPNSYEFMLAHRMAEGFFGIQLTDFGKYVSTAQGDFTYDGYMASIKEGLDAKTNAGENAAFSSLKMEHLDDVIKRFVPGEFEIDYTLVRNARDVQAIARNGASNKIPAPEYIRWLRETYAKKN